MDNNWFAYYRAMVKEMIWWGVNRLGYYDKFTPKEKLQHRFSSRIDRREPVFSYLIKNYPRNSKLLDVGCGVGRFLLYAQEYFQVTGIDNSKAAISEAREKCKKANFIHEDIFKSKRLNKYSIITLFDVLEHVKNPGLLLKKITSYLDSAGILVISVPNYESITKSVRKDLWWAKADSGHISILETKEWLRIIRESGYKVEKSFASGIINYPLPPYRLSATLKGLHMITQPWAILGLPLPHYLNDVNIWLCSRQRGWWQYKRD